MELPQNIVYNYELVQINQRSPCFQAVYNKRYKDLPYCVLFETYPLTETKALVIRKAAQGEALPISRLYTLYSKGVYTPNIPLGDYVIEAIATSEDEADRFVCQIAQERAAAQYPATTKEHGSWFLR